MKTKSVLKFAALAIGFAQLFAFISVPAPTKFKVDTKASTITWTGKKVTGQHNGNISVSSGELTVEGKIIKQGSFEIDVNSITVTDITDKDSNAKLLGHLKSDDFFGVEKFPKANFVISSITPKAGNNYTIKGKLTIKGITSDIEFPASITNDGKQIIALAKIVINRTKYDIRYRSTSFFENLGDKAIYDDFELDLKLIASVQKGV